MTVKEGSMHAQEVYLHRYCLVVTRLDKIHCIYLLPWVTPAGIFLQPPRGVPIIVWAAEHAGGFFTMGIFYCVRVRACVCAFVSRCLGSHSTIKLGPLTSTQSYVQNHHLM